MIEGQYLDITAADVEVLELHRLKTGALFAAAVGSPLALAERADERRLDGVRRGIRPPLPARRRPRSTATAPSSATALSAHARSSPPTRPRSPAARSAAWTRTRTSSDALLDDLAVLAE